MVFERFKGNSSKENPAVTVLKEIAEIVSVALKFDSKSEEACDFPHDHKDRDVCDVKLLEQRYMKLFLELREIEKERHRLHGKAEEMQTILDVQTKKIQLLEQDQRFYEIQSRKKDAEYGSKLKQLENQQRETLDEVVADHRQQQLDSKRKHKERNQQYEADISNLKIEKRNLERQIARDRDDMVKQLEQQRETSEASETVLRQYHKEERQKHEKELGRLVKDIQSRNKALVARETFTPIEDGQLKSSFFDIDREVDKLSRLNWSFNHSDWSDTLQAQISDNPKRLKKYILQDTIWAALFDDIFCSPFRVFGSEGKIIEANWSEAYGQGTANTGGYTWPKPDFGAERWRYETVRQCQEIVQTTVSDYHPQVKLHHSYRAHLESVQERILMQLKKVNEVDEKTRQLLRTIIDKAAKAWILFGTQRCRLVIVIHGLDSTIDSKGPEKEHNGNVELVLRPELRRIGDSDGQALDKEQVVVGCEGEAKKILYTL
ncbi:hypothetical protein EJ04DRAFT_580833 [Polyplosphaeria fusca]|uniref:Uncharacterized protein n=1 Tax=Polyplosphaeria fusca TaxID=682080 RepID=A0A9P4QP32_9PLEO|nr:hypothetical protein EJ04DRAFT_580833 [Polyplosphaeria fusca]